MDSIELIQILGIDEGETFECESCTQYFGTIKCYKNTSATIFIPDTKIIHIHVCDSEICLNIAILKFMGENE
jgi:hypothetical protein